MFSCEFCEISNNTFFYGTPLVAASVVTIARGKKEFRWNQGILDNSINECDKVNTSSLNEKADKVEKYKDVAAIIKEYEDITRIKK